jgi:hypothetical protein
MQQYTFEEVKGLTFAELGAIDDPMALMATGSLAPMLIRYIVRTVQLESRYPGVSFADLLNALNNAAAMIPFPPEVGQRAPIAQRAGVVDEYLDELRSHVQSALKPH